MIIIQNQPLDTAALISQYPEDSVERDILRLLAGSGANIQYDSVDQLKFELLLRREIIQAANELYKSKLAFKVFRKTTCNPDFWIRRSDGGFALRSDVRPSDAIRDIYKNSSKYGTECATAMQIVYYKALLEVFGDDAFDQIFPNIILMNWHMISKELREVGFMHPAPVYLPGDRRYFANPDVDPLTPEWQGENVIDLSDGLFYGHGIGRHRAETFIKLLNGNRRDGADESAYLMDSAARPDFKRLHKLYRNYVPAAAIRPAFA